MDLNRLEGRVVRARVLGADGIPDGDLTLYPDDRPEAVVQIGALTINYVEPLDYYQYIVNGIPVDRDSITPINHLHAV